MSPFAVYKACAKGKAGARRHIWRKVLVRHPWHWARYTRSRVFWGRSVLDSGRLG